jgi:hypothetical protein
MIDHYGALVTRSPVRNLSKVSIIPRLPEAFDAANIGWLRLGS